MPTRNQFVTFVIPEEYTKLLKWFLYHKSKGANMSALLRDTLLKGIEKEEKEKPPQWFLDWLKDNNGVQPSISDNITNETMDFGGLWEIDE